MVKKTIPEPYCDSALSNEQRRALVLEATRRKIGKEGVQSLLVDNARAAKKAAAAAKQLARPNDQNHRVYSSPEVRAESATDSVTLMQSAISEYAMIGAKVRQGAKDGHAATHGSYDEKQQKWASYQSQVDGLSAQHPSWNWERIKQNAAKNMDCSEKTIQRRTTNPRQKS